MTPNKFVITITGDDSGIVTAHDDRTGETEKWAGVMIVLGDEPANRFAHFSWGAYKSIVYGMYGSIMDAKQDRTEIGHHHRTVLGAVCRMIMELYDLFRRTNEMGAEEALRRWEEADEGKEAGKKIDKDTMFH